MIKYFSALFIAALFIAIVPAQDKIIDLTNPSDYLPDNLANVYLGMAFSEFNDLMRPEETMIKDTSYGIIYTQWIYSIKNKDISSFVYAFEPINSWSHDSPAYLTAIEFGFYLSEELDEYTFQKFGINMHSENIATLSLTAGLGDELIINKFDLRINVSTFQQPHQIDGLRKAIKAK